MPRRPAPAELAARRRPPTQRRLRLRSRCAGLASRAAAEGARRFSRRAGGDPAAWRRPRRRSERPPSPRPAKRRHRATPEAAPRRVAARAASAAGTIARAEAPRHRQARARAAHCRRRAFRPESLRRRGEPAACSSRASVSIAIHAVVLAIHFTAVRSQEIARQGAARSRSRWSTRSRRPSRPRPTSSRRPTSTAAATPTPNRRAKSPLPVLPKDSPDERDRASPPQKVAAARAADAGADDAAQEQRRPRRRAADGRPRSTEPPELPDRRPS